MTSEEFVSAIKTVAYRGAISDVLQCLEDPPGREPDPTDVMLADWFRKLPDGQREVVSKIIGLAAFQATYNFLLVLDGLAAIEGIGEKGELELFFHKGLVRVRINDPNEEELTVLFKQID